MERSVLRVWDVNENALSMQTGVNEKAIPKRHHYMAFVCDLDKATMEYPLEELMKKMVVFHKAFGTARKKISIERKRF